MVTELACHEETDVLSADVKVTVVLLTLVVAQWLTCTLL